MAINLYCRKHPKSPLILTIDKKSVIIECDECGEMRRFRDVNVLVGEQNE